MRRFCLAISLLIGGCGGESFDIGGVDDAGAETSVTEPDTGAEDTALVNTDSEAPPDTEMDSGTNADTSPVADTSVDSNTVDADAMACDSPISCYTDLDGDGFAPAGASEIRACACPKGTTPKSPTVTVDCNDDDPRVRPGTATFYTEPYCVPGTSCTVKSFDYNCNGTEEKQYGVFSSCTTSCVGIGYAGAVDCGVTATLTQCKTELVCQKKTAETAQGCH